MIFCQGPKNNGCSFACLFSAICVREADTRIGCVFFSALEKTSCANAQGILLQFPAGRKEMAGRMAIRGIFVYNRKKFIYLL